VYMRADDGLHHAFQLHTLTLSTRGVTHVTSFFDVSLFPIFGLPEVLPAGQRRQSG
jgi:RNA polymerase sigma-70 factor, ECF subfamily